MKALATQKSFHGSLTHHKPEKVAPVGRTTSLSTGATRSTLLQRQSNCACGGGCPRCEQAALIETPLSISKPSDRDEQAADRIAESVMQISETSLQRQVEPKEPRIQTQIDTALPTQAGSEVPPIVQEVLRSPSQPLDSDTRAFMDSRFGYDFSQVRVHTDAKAAESAQAVNALAYTVNQDLVFGSGHYAPNTFDGQRLIAHELAHVVQQHSLSPQSNRPSNSWQGQGFGRLQRKSKAPSGHLCGGAWTCAASPCDVPETAPSPTPSTSWKLSVMIDTEAPSPEEVTESTVGHTYVKFTESNGAVYTYGFYPDPSTHPNVLQTKVFGCVVHPDKTHASCVDYEESFTLTQPEYQSALTFAQTFCKAPLNYDLQTWNCTTFAAEVAKKASKSLPTMRGKVGGSTIGLTADNPNTLLEGLLDRDIPSRHLESDTQMREWVAANSAATIDKLPVTEKVRLMNRLLNGWVSDDDLVAIEKICSSVTSAAEMASIKTAISPRVKELNSKQGGRLQTAIDRTI